MMTEGAARKEMAERQVEAHRKAESGEADKQGIHQCEICYTRGVGEDDLNLICDECQRELPSLLKSVGDLHPLRELYQEYQEAKEAQETNDWNRKWLNRFMPLIDKLLE